MRTCPLRRSEGSFSNTADKIVTDVEEAKSDIARIWEQYCKLLCAGDAARLSDLFTDEAQMMQPNIPAIVGRRAISALFEQLGSHDFASTQSVELAVLGRSAYEFGEYRSVHSQPDPIEYRGRFAVAWRQGESGRWRIHRMMLTPLSANPVREEGTV